MGLADYAKMKIVPHKVMTAAPGVNVIKLFFFVADDEAKQARVFAPGKNFPV